MSEPFNPLALDSLAHSIVTKMAETPSIPIRGIQPFMGAGIYAIYYHGEFEAYSRLVDAFQHGYDLPIYVGKAVPAGGRRGIDVGVTSRSTALSTRIRQHGSSIDAATNLDVLDFTVRWLVLEDIWISLGESALIREKKPVWNSVVDGFGNHDPGSGRRAGQRPRWDTLHPGRGWAELLAPRVETAEDIGLLVENYLQVQNWSSILSR
jgi:hypothetical protein